MQLSCLFEERSVQVLWERRSHSHLCRVLDIRGEDWLCMMNCGTVAWSCTSQTTSSEKPTQVSHFTRIGLLRNEGQVCRVIFWSRLPSCDRAFHKYILDKTYKEGLHKHRGHIMRSERRIDWRWDLQLSVLTQELADKQSGMSNLVGRMQSIDQSKSLRTWLQNRGEGNHKIIVGQLPLLCSKSAHKRICTRKNHIAKWHQKAFSVDGESWMTRHSQLVTPDLSRVLEHRSIDGHKTDRAGVDL